MTDHGFDFSEPTTKFLNRVRSLKAEGTYEARTVRLKRWEQWCNDMGIEPTNADSRDVDDYVMYLADDGLAPGTIGEFYNSVSALYRFLVSRDYADEHPMNDLQRDDYDSVMTGTKKEAITREALPSITADEKELLVEHRTPPKGRNELILRLLWQTAVREFELVNVRLEDVNRERRTINIRGDKTYQNRIVGYQPSVDLLMDRWLDHGGRDAYSTAKDSKFLFPSRQSEKMKTGMNKMVVKPAAEAAGIQETLYVDAGGGERKRVTTHSLRHGAALQCLENGMDIESLRRLMGHKNLETTKRYVQKSDDTVVNDAHSYGAGSEA